MSNLCDVLCLCPRMSGTAGSISILAVKHDYEILCAKSKSQECEGALQCNTSCLYEILNTFSA